MNNLPSNLLLNPQVGDPLAFHSATHFTTIATLTSSTGTSFRIAACADTGASLNCIDMKTVLRLKLPIKTMDSPITVTFANQSTQQLTQVVDVLICIGSGPHAYQEVHAFAICPIGDQLLLGSPWWDGIRATIDSCRQFFMFQRTIEPPSTPMKHKFTFATPQEIIMLGRQLPTLSPIRKISSKQVDKLARKRNNTICYVDLKEVLYGPIPDPATPPQQSEVEQYMLHLDQSDLNPRVKQMIHTFSDRFHPPTTLPPSRPEDMQIDLLPDSKAPVSQGLRRMNEKELTELKNALKILLKRKQIRVSSSEYGSQILFVKKADGSLRLCVDYRALNAITRRNRCPIPYIGDLRPQIRGKNFLTKFDLRDGYYNVRMHSESIHKTAFKCALGLYEFTVLPFGLTNAPAVFSQMMNRIFGDLYGISVIIYLDDIVVFSETEDQHLLDVSKVLTRMREHSLHIKFSKCEFFRSEVDFCGHTITGTGIKVSESKVAALQNPPPFRSRKDIMRFLGVTVWFQDFVPNYAAILSPVTDLLKKDIPFHWQDFHSKAINTVIEKITSAPILSHFDHTLSTRIHSDASQYAIGGWIEQEHPDGWFPVVFVSRKLTAHEINYANPEREMLAMVYTLEKQGHYLRCGIPVEVNIDCKSLEHIQTMELTNRRVARWILLLQDYNLTLRYVKGSQNTVADYLSRNAAVAPNCHTCNKKIRIFKVSATNSLESKATYTAACTTDPLLLEVIAWQKHRSPSPQANLYKQFSLINGTWFFNTRIFIPHNAPMKLDILRRYHDTATAGHQGIRRTGHTLKRYYFWPQMDRDIEQYVFTCDDVMFVSLYLLTCLCETVLLFPKLSY